MKTCNECEFFFSVPEGADDYAKGRGDCVIPKEDEKGKYWLSSIKLDSNPCCEKYNAR